MTIFSYKTPSKHLSIYFLQTVNIETLANLKANSNLETHRIVQNATAPIKW